MALSFAASVSSDGLPEAGSAAAIVPWWSFTKTLIAASTLRLCERGVVELDAPLGDHPFSLRQLLQHRAGVRDYGGLAAYRDAVAAGADPWPDDLLLERAGTSLPLFAPDTGWAYSNIGYLLVRRTIERRTGRPLTAILREEILGPLGLAGARFASERADMDATAFPGGHSYHPGWVYHGLVVGPASEAALALHRLATGGLLSPRSKAAMLARHAIGGAVPGRPWTAHGYGLGLMTGEMDDGSGAPLRVFGHSAGGPGSAGAVYHCAATGRTAAVFTDDPSEAPAEFAALRLLRG